VPHARVPAFAKINLSLEVLWKRPDGYHDIATVFQTIDLCDWLDIEVTPAAVAAIEVTSSVAIPGENIAARAARAVLTHLGLPASVRIHIEKHIPLGGGLGGSSTDGSAVLATLPRLLGHPLSVAELEPLGAALGSDVNFFLHGGTAAAFGRGDQLLPLPNLPVLPGLLIAPGFPVSTPDAYRALNRPTQDPNLAAPARNRFDAFLAQLTSRPLSAWGPLCQNDFETVAFAQHPQLAILRQQLASTGAPLARMSGSGSSLFALFESAPPELPGAIPFRTLPRFA
jgi:4-diphosphocytidyl-2-C-methyl-D-erythritol kinase